MSVALRTMSVTVVFMPELKHPAIPVRGTTRNPPAPGAPVRCLGPGGRIRVRRYDEAAGEEPAWYRNEHGRRPTKAPNRMTLRSLDLPLTFPWRYRDPAVSAARRVRAESLDAGA